MYYEEKKDPAESAQDYDPQAGPMVERDCLMVKEIAEDAPAFALHSRPRYYRQRDEQSGR